MCAKRSLLTSSTHNTVSQQRTAYIAHLIALGTSSALFGVVRLRDDHDVFEHLQVESFSLCIARSSAAHTQSSPWEIHCSTEDSTSSHRRDSTSPYSRFLCVRYALAQHSNHALNCFNPRERPKALPIPSNSPPPTRLRNPRMPRRPRHPRLSPQAQQL